MKTRETRRGVTLTELILVIAIIAVLGVITVPTLLGRRGKSDLENTTSQLVSLLREAQSRSVAQSSDSAWGVRFDNAVTSSPSFALFYGSYSTSTVVRRNTLPRTLRYATSSITEGGSLEVMFRKLSGFASSSASLRVEIVRIPTVSSTITVATSGLVGGTY